MMCLDQNKQCVYYALIEGIEELQDENGNFTGEYAPAYSEPVEMRMNVSAARNDSEYAPFGIDEKYTKTAVTDNMSCPIAIDSVLWIGKEPFDDDDNVTPYNYVVKRIARSLNSITYALAEVDVSE